MTTPIAARRRLHRRRPSSIERCVFAHETVDDEPTPAFFRVVELEAASEYAAYRDAAGLANLPGSIRVFGCTFVNVYTLRPSSQLIVHLNGIFTPVLPTSR
jgi:hypothetical protein